MKIYKHPNARVGPDLGPGRDKAYSEHVRATKERVGKAIKQSKQSDHAIGTAKRYEEIAKEFYHD